MKYTQFSNENATDDSQKPNDSNDKKKKKTSLKRVCCYLIIGIIAMTFVFVSGCLINLLKSYEYEVVFDHIKITSEYDEIDIPSLLPKVDMKIKDIVFEHRVVSSKFKDKPNVLEEEMEFSYFLRILKAGFRSVTNGLKHKMQKRKELRIFTEHHYEFKITKVDTDHNSVSCMNVSVASSMKKTKTTGETEVCFNLGGNSWFGGHESLDQPYWPINAQVFDYVPYVTGFPERGWSALLERYWLSSNGLAIFIDDSVPLFVSHSDPNKICLKSSNSSAPYKYTPVYTNAIEYKICSGPEILTTHRYMINNYLGKPLDRPDSIMQKYPVFTTWNYFFKHINQSVVLDYARQIAEHNYTISQLEIDDLWEHKYGDLDFDRSKFPNPSQMVDQMHDMNMRVTLWVHPFCNIDSYNFVNGTLNGLWVKDANGQHPGFTSWWNGNDAVILDYTNPNAAGYFKKKLDLLKRNYGIDAFKFDAGETDWIPSEFSLYNNLSKPDAYAQSYVETASSEGDFIEVRTGYRLQKHGIYFRILDRGSDWTIHNGIKSVITATLHFGLLGYTFVLPDIIGGNGDPDKANKELFIRWTQLTAFMPAMQFGVPPWYFDEETNTICKKYVDLRASVIFLYINILELNGDPIVRPMWYMEPANKQTFNMSDQFMVGDQILVAPILDQGAYSRDVYFPSAEWYDPEEQCYYTGPGVHKNLAASLDRILYFYSESFIKQINPDFRSFIPCSEKFKL